MTCGFAALVAKLWWEQVARGPYWAKKIANRSQVTVRIPSVRGEIRDRNGVTLVTNRASYEVDFYLPDMVRGFKRQHGWVPLTKFRAPVKQMLTEMKEADIREIVNAIIMPRLQELELYKDNNSQQLQKHYRNDSEVPFTYLSELDSSDRKVFGTRRGPAGCGDFQAASATAYVYGALAAHPRLRGGAGGHRQARGRKRLHVLPAGRRRQVAGREIPDKYIRGQPGVRVMQRSVKGVIEGEVDSRPPKQGDNVYLTIDTKIQYIAERALRDAHIGRGAAVVVNPKNGDILAMVSVPSYDPNKFIPEHLSKDWEKLSEDDTDPLTNRGFRDTRRGPLLQNGLVACGFAQRVDSQDRVHLHGRGHLRHEIHEMLGRRQACGPTWLLPPTLPDALKFLLQCISSISGKWRGN